MSKSRVARLSKNISGALAILLERIRQVEKEGWTHLHDDEHDNGELVDAAICYLGHVNVAEPSPGWPFDEMWWKPEDREANLIRAGALIAAELDRLYRCRRKDGDQ